MRYQRRSETFRSGEPESHKSAAQKVCDIVDGIKFFFTSQREVIKFPDKYEHEFDIIIRNQKEDWRITHFVEIGFWGDDSKHQFKTAFAPNRGQQKNDGIVEGHVKEYYPNAIFVRINKKDCDYPEFILSQKCLCMYNFIK